MAGEQIGAPSTGPYTADGGINPLYNRGLPAYKLAPPRNQSEERREFVVRSALATVAVVVTLCALALPGLLLLLLWV